MLSARKMVEVADDNIKNASITKIEERVVATAHKGKFFVELWNGKPVSMDTQLIFVEVYDVEAYNYLMRLGYVVTTYKHPDGKVSLYIGWGFENVNALNIAIKSDSGV